MGTLCGDCDDTLLLVNPAAEELCGDGLDNNCDGEQDEGFFLGEACAVCDPPEACPHFSNFCLPGTDCPVEDGTLCLTSLADELGTPLTVVVCDGLIQSKCDIPETDIVHFQSEGLGSFDPGNRTEATCSDLEDNDCDDLVDLQDPDCFTQEFCDSLDNDGDGEIDEDFGVGTACSAGIGVCERTGVRVCTADETGAECTATPRPAKVEGPFTSPSCSDGKDNDCDGLTDFPDDPDCTGVEVCDGIDNDGDGGIDEDFGDLGDTCSTGVGACFATGQRVCLPDRSGTFCNAVAGLPEVEGLANPGSCGDGIDNDCDGFSDGDDPACAAGLVASCALPYHEPPGPKVKTKGNNGRGKPGSDCNSWHRIEFGVPPGFEGAQVNAELLALDLDGQPLATIPVQVGDIAHLVSRIDAEDFRVETKTTAGSLITHDVFAPIPLLRVTADDGIKRTQAFCSLIPYLQVVEPSGTVVTESEGNVTQVMAAMPLVDPTTLFVKVDGVDILSALGIDPAVDFPGGPFDGTVMIHGEMVEVTDLFVDSSVALDPGAPSSNTFTMTLSNLPCGGHVVVVDSESLPGALPAPVSAACHVDDIRDKGFSSVFAVDITNPTPQQVTTEVPTPVAGQVCHGRPIAGLDINGKPVDTSGQILQPGDGEDSADTYLLDFSTTLGATDLAQDLSFGNISLGTFDAGSNRLVAAATDDQGNRTFEGLFFATGEVAAPAVASVLAPFQAQLKDELEAMALKHFTEALTTGTEVDNAFVVGLTPNAIQTVFQQKCQEAAQSFVAGVGQKVQIGQVISSQKISGGCSCDPTVNTVITGWSIDANAISCPVTFFNDRIHVLIDLPDVNISLRASGSCKKKVLGVCVAKTSVNAGAQINISNLKVEFDITENQLLGISPPPPPIRGVCQSGFPDAGQPCGLDSDCAGECIVANINTVVTNPSVSVGCLASICNWVFNVFAAIINGIAGTQILDPVIVSFTADDIEFNTEIGAGEVDPFALEEIKVDEEVVEEFGQQLSGQLTSVEITPQGLLAGLKGVFATVGPLDPNIPETPGALLTPAPLPTMPIPNAGDASVLLADDTINMMFASLTSRGTLKANCQDIGKTVGDLLPADCDTITVPLATPEATDAATTAARALCHGIRGANCETLVGPNLLLTPVEQGICHGMQGTACATIPAGLSGIVQPADCETISIVLPDNPGLADVATAIAQGLCYGSKAADCETLTAATDTLTAQKQGACHGAEAADCQTVPVTVGFGGIERGTCEGVKGTTCASLPVGQPLNCTVAQTVVTALDTLLFQAEQGACNATPPLNLNATQPLVFCTQQDIPPAFKIMDELATPEVETALRLNDLSMAILVDRDSNGLTGDLGSVPKCFATGSPTVGDCNLFAVCLDLNLLTRMQFQTCTDGKPGLVTQFDQLQILNRQQGVVCGAATAGDDATVVDESATDNATIEVIELNVDTFTPPVCANGLDLGGFVNFVAPQLLAVETDGLIDFQDYVGLTGDIQP